MRRKQESRIVALQLRLLLREAESTGFPPARRRRRLVLEGCGVHHKLYVDG